MFKENMFVQITKTKSEMNSDNHYKGIHDKGDVVMVGRTFGHAWKAHDDIGDMSWLRDTFATPLEGDYFEELEVDDGDTVVCVELNEKDEDEFTLGKQYTVHYNWSEGSMVILDDNGCESSDTWSLFAKVEDLSEPSPAPALVEAVVAVEPPRPEFPEWKDLTDLEKGELLLSHHEGKTIQVFMKYGEWEDHPTPHWQDEVQYRVKPEKLIKIEELKAQIKELEAELQETLNVIYYWVY